MDSENRSVCEDRRVKRTKRILRDSLFRLLSEKPLDKISVKELTELAEINRSTFYFYYKDLDDMVSQLQNDIYARFEKEVLSVRPVLAGIGDLADYIKKFLDFIVENAEFCLFAVDSDEMNSLADRIRAALLANLPGLRSAFPPSDPRRYITEYAMQATWTAIVCWMHENMPVGPEEFSRFLASAYFYGGRAMISGEQKGV